MTDVIDVIANAMVAAIECCGSATEAGRETALELGAPWTEEVHTAALIRAHDIWDGYRREAGVC